MQAAPDVQNESQNTRTVGCGLVLFDSPREPGLGGWAAIDGGEPVRVENVSSLRNDVVWLSNIDFSSYRAGGLEVQHNLRQSGFLRSEIRQLAGDVGINVAGEGAYDAVRRLSIVASRVYRLAEEHYGLGDTGFTQPYLAEDIRAKLRIPVSTGNVNSASDFMAAYQTDSRVPGKPFIDNSVLLSLRQNRFRHFGSLIQMPVPDNAWVHLPESALPDNINKRLDHILKEYDGKPFIVEVSMEPDCDPELAALTAFGASAASKTGLRRWVSQPELVWLMKYYKIKVRSAWVSAAYKHLIDKHLLPKHLASDDLLRLSYSAGILVENHFHALSGSAFNRTLQTKTVSPIGVWLRAYDRAIMFAHALDMYRNGFMVTGYGMGGVRVSVSRAGGELERLAEYAGENGFVYPPLRSLLDA